MPDTFSPTTYLFPAAGLGAAAYKDMSHRLETLDISVQILQRTAQESFREHVENVLLLAKRDIDALRGPSFFLAESMGGFVAAAVASRMPKAALQQPASILLFGTGTPLNTMKGFCGINKGDAWEMTRFAIAAGGIPPWVERSPGIAASLLQPLRSDMDMLADFETTMIDNIARVQVVHVRGTRDHLVTLSDAKAWEKFTDNFEHMEIPGTHLLLAHEASAKSIDIIQKKTKEPQP